MHNVWRAEIKARMAENCYFFPIFNIFQAYRVSDRSRCAAIKEITEMKPKINSRFDGIATRATQMPARRYYQTEQVKLRGFFVLMTVVLFLVWKMWLIEKYHIKMIIRNLIVFNLKMVFQLKKVHVAKTQQVSTDVSPLCYLWCYMIVTALRQSSEFWLT